MKRDLPWPWAWDDRPRGWTGNTFGPLPPEAAPAKPKPTPEQQAAAAVLTEAQQAEARRHFSPLIKAAGLKRGERF